MGRRPILLGDMKVHLVWFDSLGAKSSSLLIETPDIKLLIDPGAAVMQPGYPLSDEEKRELREEAFGEIKKAASKADHIFISHYHYDHHTLPSEAEGMYGNKTLWIKDPNLWINASQWERSRVFLGQLYGEFAKGEFKEVLAPPEEKELSDPLEGMRLVGKKEYGDYQSRKEELLKKGKRWWENLKRDWFNGLWVREFKAKGIEVRFADGREIIKGKTRVRFTKPLFHGIEYARLGWLIALVVEYGSHKFLYTSDLQGPQVENYTEWIIEENPEALVVDGPTTYLFGYMLNRVNLKRAIDNMCGIIRKTSTKIIIYDHHNLREALYQERLKEVYKTAEEEGKVVLTAAEWFGEEPLILRIRR